MKKPGKTLRDSFKIECKRDPRYGKLLGGVMGAKSSSQSDRISSISPFFSEFGTHRAPHGGAVLDESRKFCRSKDDELIRTGRQWKTTPGPGTYRTVSVIGNPPNQDSVDASKTLYSRAARSRVVGYPRHGPVSATPGPADYAPDFSGYTSMC